MIRFLLILLVGYSTTMGYSIMIPATSVALELKSEVMRDVFILVAGAAYALGVSSLVSHVSAKQYECALLVFAVVCGYISLVSATVALQMKPMFTDFQWWMLFAYFSLPFVLSSAYLSQAKYEERPAAVAG